MSWMGAEVNDFSGGFTDNFIDTNPARYQLLDNFVLDSNRKALTRPGSNLFDSNHFSVLAGSTRTGYLINFQKDTYLFSQQGKNIYYTNGTWQSLLGPVTSNAALSQGSTSNYIDSTEWNKHLLVVDDAYSLPIKIYIDQNSALQLRSAGLPLIDLTGAISQANDLKAQFNSHIASATIHAHADTVHKVTTSDAYDLQTLITLLTSLLTNYAAHRLDATLVSPAYHVATSSGNALASTAAPRTLAECITRLNDLVTKYNAHDADNTAHAVANSKQESVVNYPTNNASGSGHTYLYKFAYYYTYQVGSVIFEDFGPTSEMAAVKVTNAIDSGHQVTISNIPVLVNGSNSSSGNNWDTTAVTLRIYRTADGGTTFYQVTELANGTTSYADGVQDSILTTNAQLYTNGGVVDNDQPLPAKYIHSVNGYTYYANVKEGSQVLPNRLLQSILNDPDSVPGSFNFDFEDDITALSSVNSRLIVFTKKWAYRVEGYFDELGRGGFQVDRINDAAGCVSNQSVVQTTSGLYYAGIDGFYYTDGYQVIKLSTQWNTTYASLISTSTKQLRIQGTYEPLNQRIYWTIKKSDSSADNDSVVILDLRYGIKPDSCFYTWSWKNNIFPSAITYYNSQIVISDYRGYLFKFSDSYLTDPKIDTNVTPTSWATKTIIWDYLSCSSDLGSSQIRKFVNRIIFQGRNETNVSIQINSINDQGKALKALKLIRWTKNIIWGSLDIVWGTDDSTTVWGLDQMIEAKRRFPAGGMRCSYKQIEITNGFSNIANSDTRGNVSIDATLKTVTLLNAGRIWEDDPIDYYISFLADNYTTNYLITARNSSTKLTYQDNLNTSATSASSKWVLRGYKKGEHVSILKYVVEFAPLTDSQDPYPGGTYLGNNA